VRIVHFLPRIRLVEGGVVRAVLDLTAGLARAGHDVVLLTRDDQDAPRGWTGEDDLPRIERIDLGSFGALRTGGGPDGVAARAIRDADIVHLHTPWEPANVALSRLARRSGAPYVLTAHGMLDNWAMAQKSAKKRVYMALAGRRLLDHAAFIHCTAEGERLETARRLPHDRIRVVPLLADLEALSGPPPAPSDGPAEIVFLGRVVPGKGLELLIDAVARLAPMRSDLLLTIAGPISDAYRAALERRAIDAGVASVVRFVGFVAGEEKRTLLARASVAVSLSAHENFGFTLIEATLCETPVVTTRQVAIWKDLERAGGAVIVNRDAESAAAAIDGLLRDPTKAGKMGRIARERLLQWLDPERTLGEYERLYQDARGAE